jgi:hypothetical protein
MHPLAVEVIMMALITIVTGGMVHGATLLHRYLGAAALFVLGGLMLASAGAPNVHLATALLSVYFLWRAYVNGLPQNRDRPPANAVSPAPQTVASPPPAARAPGPRAAIPCPGCGAGVRPGGTCAYCGRHV